VTRTDLLRTLSPQAPIPGRRRIDDRLEEALPAAHVKLLRSVAAEADRAQVALYIVGGFVRDLLLGRPSLDFDLVVEGDAIALARAVSAAHGGRVTAHRRFGTAKWHLDGLDFGLDSIDLVTARTEFYTHPTALPTVERGSIKLDLHRRDFTLNTLAVRLDGSHFGELHDYWGGVSDLRQKLIRVLHSLSFVDDPTRMLRAVRFEQRFGFSIEPRTLELLKAALGLLDRVSGDRIRHELENVFTEPAAEAMFSRLDELGLLEAIHPGLGGVHHPEMFACDLPGEAWELESGHRGLQLDRALPYLHWWIRTSPARARGFSRRLKLKQALEAVILDAIRLLEDAPGLQGAPASAITRRLDESDRLAVFVVRSELDDGALAAAFDQYAASWRHIKPQADGRTLAEHGLAPGPAYREILGALRDAWLDGRVKTGAEEARLLE
jgi:tRNA nucleotidyltransferase (CCA-adding enzyme)